MKEKYLEECKIIEQNCTYTAEAHHRIASKAKHKGIWLGAVPAICAALTGTFVSAGFVGNWLLPFTVLSAAISAVTAIINPNKEYQDHLAAAKNFTALKHDARFLGDVQASKMNDEAFALAVDMLHQRYNEVLKSTPPTEEKEFQEARIAVQQGIHEPDRTKRGTVK